MTPTIEERIAESNLKCDEWVLTEVDFDPEQLNFKETTFTIGNGYLGTRGSFEEDFPGSSHATLINGVYDEIPIYYTELANCPNWLPLSISVNGEKFRIDKGEVLSYERKLDLKHGILTRKIRWRSNKGNTVDIEFQRFASLADQHVLCLRCQVTPVDFDGTFKILASIDGTPENEGFNHFVILDQVDDEGDLDDSVWIHARTRKTRIELGMASKLEVDRSNSIAYNASVPEVPAVAATFKAQSGSTTTVDKFVTVYTSREVDDPIEAALTKLSSLHSYDEILVEHKKAWDKTWSESDVILEGNLHAQLILRYNLYQVLIAAPRDDDRVSIPAKTLSGFGYRGHIFWDTEFFMLPFLIHTQPEIARNILTYRYHTLDGARRKARHYGFRGAMYAWESAETGDEVTPRWGVANEPYADDVRLWCRDREIHISSVIAFAIWWYWQSTQDDQWMLDYGAEIVLDTALFWSSRIEYDAKSERWSLKGVIGPDEYHDNVDDNAFTNGLVRWHMESAIEIFEWLKHKHPSKAQEMIEMLGITHKRLMRWEDIAENLWMPFDRETRLIEQFDGFFKLTDIDLNEFEPRNRSIQSILGMEATNEWQVVKQPDVLLLLMMMRAYPKNDYGLEVLRKNWDYYAPRTDVTHGSSLGPGMQGLVAAELGLVHEAFDCFRLAALVDLIDNRGNTADGIHGASCGNIWQHVIYGVAGVQFTEKGPKAHPHFPPGWTRLKFKLKWHGDWYEFDLKSQLEDPNQLIKGFIFDLDGVITDTAEYHYQAWQKLANEEELEFNREKNEALRGLSRHDSLLKIIGGQKNYTESEIEEMMERKNEYYKKLIKEINPKDLLPGVLDLLDELRFQGMKIALGSASKNAKAVVDRLGIARKFDAVADGHSVKNSKPAPDLFLYAAERLGLEPEQCVVIEDSEAGIEAALAGGMHTIGLGPKERVGRAQVVLKDLKGATWATIKKKLMRKKVTA